MIRARGERGAALVIVLVFMVVTLILITAVLAVTSNEIQISGLHRDSVAAFELAQAALVEVGQRIQGRHPFVNENANPHPAASCRDGSTPDASYASPLPLTQEEAARTNVSTWVCGAGTGTQVLELGARAQVGNAVRILSQLVRVRARNVPPEIVLTDGLTASGSAGVPTGSVYAPRTARYSNNIPGRTYTGWRTGNLQGQTTNWCYGRERTYVLKSTNLGSGGADFNKELSVGTQAATTVTVSVADAATEDSFGFTPAGNPSQGGIAGNFTVEVEVTTAQPSISISVAVARVNSALVQQAISAFSAPQAATAGVKTFSLGNVALGTWVDGDRLKVIYHFVNSSGAAQSVTIRTGTRDTEVVPPWTVTPVTNCPYDDAQGNNWYPGTRRTTLDETVIGDILQQLTWTVDGTGSVTCNIPQTSAPESLPNSVKADDPGQQAGTFLLYGFDEDDGQARTNKLPCGLPYRYVQDGTTDAGRPLYFKTVIYTDTRDIPESSRVLGWFEAYHRWQLTPEQKLKQRDGSACGSDPDAVCRLSPPAPGSPWNINSLLTTEPNLKDNPQFAAIPTFPRDEDLRVITQNARTVNNPGTITGGNFGTPPQDPTSCPATGGDAETVHLTGGDYRISGNINGYGIIVVDGGTDPNGVILPATLRTQGSITYRGTIIVKGNVEIGAGNVTIRGGLVASGSVNLTGNLTIEGTDCVGTLAFTNELIVEFGAMWEQ